MSWRFYWISFLIIFGLTFLISWVKQIRTPREISMILLKVFLGVTGLGLALFGLSKLLVILGIAKDGFII